MTTRVMIRFPHSGLLQSNMQNGEPNSVWARSMADDTEVVPPFECPIGSLSPALERRDVPGPANRPLDMECGGSTPLFLTRLDASLLWSGSPKETAVKPADPKRHQAAALHSS